MAKRFTDTALGRKKWFRLLSPKMKCAWRFLCDECDHAGIWDIDEDSFKYFIGESVTMDEVIEAFGDRVEVLADQKLFVKAFVEFQYGTLNPANKVHLSVQKRHEKVGACKHLARPLQGAKDTDTEKDTDKERGSGGKTLFDFWNSNCSPLPKAEKFTDKRRSQANAQSAKCPDAFHWEQVLTRWKRSDFCLSQWKPTFDDFLNENKRVATLEGKYDNRSPKGAPDALQINRTQKILEGIRKFGPDEGDELKEFLGDELFKLACRVGVGRIRQMPRDNFLEKNLTGLLTEVAS